MDKQISLQQALSQVGPLNQEAARQAQIRWDHIAKPLHSLGLLEDMVMQMAAITGHSQLDIRRRACVVYCADNGVVAEGVTQTDSSVTAVVTENFAKGETSVCQMARVAGVQVLPVDIGVADPISHPGVINRRIASGTGNIAREPAMTRQQAIQALEVGIQMAYDLKQRGFGLLATGEMGIGNTTTSSALTAALLGVSPREVTGRGAGLSTEGLQRKVAAIERALALHRPHCQDAVDWLACVGGYDIAGMAGTFIGGAAFRVPVLVDGFISAAAALVAVQICPAVKPYLMASHVSAEPAGALLAQQLGLKAPLVCGMCLGEGTGAVAVIPLLDMALAVYQGMSTFDEIHIDQYQPLV